MGNEKKYHNIGVDQDKRQYEILPQKLFNSFIEPQIEKQIPQPLTRAVSALWKIDSGGRGEIDCRCFRRRLV